VRTYAIMRPQFWTRGSGKKLRGNQKAQVLAMFLMTCGQGTRCGIFPVALPTIAHETGLALDELPDLFKVVSEIAQYDDEEELCWVPNSAREQLGETLKPSDNKWKGLLAEVGQFLKHRFGRAFVEMYREAYSLPFEAAPKVVASSIVVPSKPLPSPSEGSATELKGASEPQGKVRTAQVLGSGEAVPPAVRRVVATRDTLAEALELPVKERAALALRDPMRREYMRAEQWPEVLEVATALADALGHEEPRLSPYDRDSGVALRGRADARGAPDGL
jgi:hypothetical protein